jgi:hypothetical protein
MGLGLGVKSRPRKSVFKDKLKGQATPTTRHSPQMYSSFSLVLMLLPPLLCSPRTLL